MNKETALQVLVYLSKLEGFARGTHKNEMLPDDMWDEMVDISEILANIIKDEK